MTQVLLELEQRASTLSDAERAQLALFLLESLDPADNDRIDEACCIEAESGLAEIEKAEASLVPAEDVFKNLRHLLS